MSAESRSTLSGILAWILIHGMFALVALIGLMAVPTGLRLIWDGDPNLAGAIVAVLMGLVCLGFGLGFFYITYLKRPQLDARKEQVRAKYPNQPWMERADWAARRVVHSNAGVVAFMWIWVIGWWSGIVLIGTVNYDKIVKAFSESWGNIALASVFVLGGLVGASIAVKMTRSWLRFGRSTLWIDTLPAFTGGRFRGRVETGLKAPLTHPLTIELVCEEIEWITTGSGKNRRTEAKAHPLGRSSINVEPARLASKRTGATVPIDIEVPSGLPETSQDAQGSGVRWTLRVSTSARDGDLPFSCDFSVPVYDQRRAKGTTASKVP